MCSVVADVAHLSGPGRGGRPPCSVWACAATCAAERVSAHPGTPGPPSELSWWLRGCVFVCVGLCKRMCVCVCGGMKGQTEENRPSKSLDYTYIHTHNIRSFLRPKAPVTLQLSADGERWAWPPDSPRSRPQTAPGPAPTASVFHGGEAHATRHLVHLVLPDTIAAAACSLHAVPSGQLRGDLNIHSAPPSLDEGEEHVSERHCVLQDPPGGGSPQVSPSESESNWVPLDP